jgi:hypothetical protein
VPLPPQKPGRLAATGAPPAGEDAIGKSRREKDELQTEVHGAEEELEALKARYEMWFLGVERREPARWRDDVKKKILRLKGAFTRNAALRFRIQSLNARYLSYERMWLRSGREKEDGTYRRDVFKARLHAKEQERKAAAKAGEPATVAVRGVEVTAGAAAQASAPPAAAATRATPPPLPTGVATERAASPPRPAGVGTDAELRALYDRYIAAKKQCNEDVSRLTYEAVAKSIAKQVPALMTQYKAKTVEFKVVVKDGRAVLKAIPKI